MSPTPPATLPEVPHGLPVVALVCAFGSVFVGGLSFVGLGIGFYSSVEQSYSDGVRLVAFASVVGLFLTVLMIAAVIATWMVWVHRAWSWLPIEERRSRLHGESIITPGQAVSRIVIPVYGLYWFLVIEDGLVDALHAMQKRSLPEGTAPAPLPKHFMHAAFASFMVAPMPPIFALAYVAHQRNVRRAMEQLRSPV